MTRDAENAIYTLLVDPKTGLGALSERLTAVHDRLDGFGVSCKAMHGALNITIGDIGARVEAVEKASAVANGVRRGRLEVILLLAKIVALFGVGSGGIAAAVACIKTWLGAQ